jgi:hypothetical protein
MRFSRPEQRGSSEQCGRVVGYLLGFSSYVKLHHGIPAAFKLLKASRDASELQIS